MEVLPSTGFNMWVTDTNELSLAIGWGLDECMNIVGAVGGLANG